ncbi:MAG TPA: CPBP family intramembrane glutamic endopeptidase [Thermoanaerobaculia bacterium]|nr:CPBP family intramembrane glutamic endopeptidase [Thermoanaerobaculia bacterium]
MSDIESVSAPGLHNARRFFYGSSGLRAGWRLLIFGAILFVLFATRNLIERRTMHGLDEASRYVVNQAARFLICLLASWIMARIERRTIADYGLPWRRMFRREFWQGALIGFVALTALLGIMRAAGVFDFGEIALHGAEIWKWGALYAVAFVLIAFSEEFFYRGYAQFTLSSGIGFWPAAILWNAYFGFSHYSNAGETWAGMVNAGLGGLLFCLLLKRSGNLWMPIGFHMAWDWGQTFFYGVPDSGVVVPGHLFNSRFSGSAWLTGGTVGPEGSWLCTLLLILVGLVVAAWLREARYPETPR